jgi:hypothetical protein
MAGLPAKKTFFFGLIGSFRLDLSQKSSSHQFMTNR